MGLKRPVAATGSALCKDRSSLARREPLPGRERSRFPVVLKVVYWQDGDSGPRPRAQDKIEAAKNVVMMDLALLSAEIANGMYKKPIEMLAKEIHYEPLPDEVRAVIIASWKRGGLLPPASIEAGAARALRGDGRRREIDDRQQHRGFQHGCDLTRLASD